MNGGSGIENRQEKPLKEARDSPPDMHKSLATITLTALLATPATATEYLKKVPCSTLDQKEQEACVSAYLEKTGKTYPQLTERDPAAENRFRAQYDALKKEAYREETRTTVTGTVIDEVKSREDFYTFGAETEYGIQTFLCKSEYSYLLDSVITPGVKFTFDFVGPQKDWNHRHIELVPYCFADLQSVNGKQVARVK